MLQRAKRSADKYSFQSEKSDDRERDTRMDDPPSGVGGTKGSRCGRVPHSGVGLETADEPQRQRIPQTRRS